MREDLREFLKVLEVLEKLGLKVDGYEIIEVEDEETFEIGEGEEVWIEDRELYGYYHFYKIVYPQGVKLEDIAEIIKVEKEGGAFERWNNFYTLKPKKDKDFVIIYERGYKDEEANDRMKFYDEYRQQIIIHKSKGGV